MQVNGSCHCGSITYQATIDPAKVTICHCTDCQMLTGTAYRVSVGVRTADFRLLTGTPAVYVKVGDSGARRGQAFCATCASPLYSFAADDPAPSVYGLRIGAMAERAELPARQQKWCRSELAWAQDIRALPGRAGD